MPLLNPDEHTASPIMKRLSLAPNRHSYLPAELYKYSIVNNAALLGSVTTAVAKHTFRRRISLEGPKKKNLFPVIPPGTTTIKLFRNHLVFALDTVSVARDSQVDVAMQFSVALFESV